MNQVQKGKLYRRGYKRILISHKKIATRRSDDN